MIFIPRRKAFGAFGVDLEAFLKRHEHWCRRVTERIGPDADPARLWLAIVFEIDAGKDDQVRLKRNLAASNGRRRRLYSVRLDGTPRFFAVVEVNGDEIIPITVAPPQTEIRKDNPAHKKCLAGVGTGKKRRRRKLGEASDEWRGRHEGADDV